MEEFILIISSHLLLGPPSGLFASDFPTKMLYAFPNYLMCATCIAHLTLLHVITITSVEEDYKF